MAPEILGFTEDSFEYTNAVDMWSLGCLASWLLIQQVLVDVSKMFMFSRGRFPLPLDLLSSRSVSAHGLDFVANLLVYRSDMRMSAQAAVQHEWLRSSSPHDGLIDDTSSAASRDSLNLGKAKSAQDEQLVPKKSLVKTNSESNSVSGKRQTWEAAQAPEPRTEVTSPTGAALIDTQLKSEQVRKEKLNNKAESQQKGPEPFFSLRKASTDEKEREGSLQASENSTKGPFKVNEIKRPGNELDPNLSQPKSSEKRYRNAMLDKKPESQKNEPESVFVPLRETRGEWRADSRRRATPNDKAGSMEEVSNTSPLGGIMDRSRKEFYKLNEQKGVLEATLLEPEPGEEWRTPEDVTNMLPYPRAWRSVENARRRSENVAIQGPRGEGADGKIKQISILPKEEFARIQQENISIKPVSTDPPLRKLYLQY